MAGTLNKYVVSFEVELYAGTAGTAYEKAAVNLIGHFRRLAEQEARGTTLKEVIDFAGELPFGGLDGAPHETDALEGWRLHWSVGLKEG